MVVWIISNEYKYYTIIVYGTMKAHIYLTLFCLYEFELIKSVDYLLHLSVVLFIAKATVPNTLIYYLNQQTNNSLCVVVQKSPKGARQSSALRGNIGLSLAGKGLTTLWLNGFYFKDFFMYLSKPNFCKVSKLLIHHKQPPYSYKHKLLLMGNIRDLFINPIYHY